MLNLYSIHVSVVVISGVVFVKTFKLFKYLSNFRSKHIVGKYRTRRINYNKIMKEYVVINVYYTISCYNYNKECRF